MDPLHPQFFRPVMRRGRLVALAAVGVVAAVVVALSLLPATGVFGPPVPPDGQVIVSVGLAVVRVLQDCAAALAIGLLVLAAWVVGPDVGASAMTLTGPRRAMTRAAVVASGGWLLAASLTLTFTAADVIGVPLSSPDLVRAVVSFGSETSLGRALLASCLLVLTAGVVAALATRVTSVMWAALLSLAAVLPLASTGHSAEGQHHEIAVDGLALHLVGVSTWVGGLAAVVLLMRPLQGQWPAVVRRYSTLAGWSFLLVAGSGFILGAVRLTELADLTGPYGLLLIGKVLALTLLGVAGWRHRAAILERLGTRAGHRSFVRLALAELVLMGATIGLAVALARTAPPRTPPATQPGAQSGGHDPALLLGHAVPPPIDLRTLLSTGYPHVFELLVGVAGLLWYLRAALALRRRNQVWPLWRVSAWCTGIAAWLFLTSGGPAVYADVSITMHLAQHVGLLVVVPLLWVSASPLTLALHTLAPRRDGTFGPRETLLLVLRSRVVARLTDPAVAAGVVAAVPSLSYLYTGLVEVALFDRSAEVAVRGLFVGSGALLVWVISGLTTGAGLQPATRSLRSLTLAVAMVSLVALGAALATVQGVVASAWWAGLGLGDALLLRQQRAGAFIPWGAAGVLALSCAAWLIRASSPTSSAPPASRE